VVVRASASKIARNVM